MAVDDYWPIPYLARVLPRGLPAGALTLMELGDAHNIGSWPDSVLRLLEELRELERPGLYVGCGATEPGAVPALARKLGSGPVRAFDDEDRQVQGPRSRLTLQGTVAPAYNLNVPTLDRLLDELAALEAEHGPALLLLDDIASARPYWAAFEADLDYALPDNYSLAEREAHIWRAIDVDEMARRRTGAPTVAVWYVQPDGKGQQDLRDLALVRLVFVEAHGQVEVRCQDRRTVLENYSAVRSAFL